jgi:signal transduction histidine kinase
MVTSIAALIMGYLAWYVWMRREAPGGFYFSLFMGACTLWALFGGIGMTVSGLQAKVLCLQIIFVGAACIPALWLLFALDYSRRTEWLRSPWLRLIWVIPVITIILEWTNPWHGLIWNSLTLTATPFGDVVIRGHGIFGWINVIYTYILILAGSGLIVWSAYRTFEKNSLQSTLLVLGAFLGVIANLVSFLGLGPWKSLDFVPFVFPIMGTIFAWGIFRESLFDLVPVARATLIQSMGHGMLVLDEHGAVTDLNPSAKRILNVLDEPVARSAEAARARWPQLAFAWLSPAEVSREVRFDGPGGVLWVDAHVSCLYDHNGRYKGRVITLWDITERKAAEELMLKSKCRTELYLDLMSHDINNFHTLALGYLEMARDAPDGRYQKSYIDKPITALKRSSQLIGNVMKLQMLDEGYYKTERVDLTGTLAEVQKEYEAAVPGRSIRLNLNGTGCCYVQANELLYDVFLNLVNNAVKHAGSSTGIIIDVGRINDRDNDFYRVAVEDDGPGIPDDAKLAIFDRMTRGATNAHGMGLGLYLVRSLVESYGGRAFVEDRVPGDHTKGARFVVLLPAAQSP